MYEVINKKLVDIKERCRLFDKWKRQQSELEAELKDAREKSKQISDKLEKEQKDVNKLEEWTLTRFIASITGKKEGKLEKEKEEALKVKLLYENTITRVKRLEQDLNKVRDSLNSLDAPYKKYDELLLEKEALIQSQYSPLTNLIFNLSEQMAMIEVQHKETDEAIHAAKKAMESLETARSELQSAKNWGFMDIAGGDFLSTMAKRSHMDQAADAIQRADYDLKRLNKELADINRDSHETIQLNNFLGITDYFFDNIFTDLAVQDRINNAYMRVEQTLDKINEMNNELLIEKSRLKEEWDRVSEKRKKEIEMVE